MWKNGANTAMDIKTFGNSNSGVNSDVLIRIDSGGDPTPGANAGTITFNINGSDRHLITGSSFGISNTSPNLTLDVGSTNGNHNIGRAILTAGNIHNADKLDSLSIGRWDGSNTTDWQFSGIRYNVTTGAAVGEPASNHSNMSFWTWGNNISNTREVMRLTSRGRLGINTTTPTELLDVNGNIKCDGNLSIGNGLIYLPKPGNSTGTIKLGLGGTTGADDTTNMKIEINGVSNGTSEAGSMILRTYTHMKFYSM